MITMKPVVKSLQKLLEHSDKNVREEVRIFLCNSMFMELKTRAEIAIFYCHSKMSFRIMRKKWNHRACVHLCKDVIFEAQMVIMVTILHHIDFVTSHLICLLDTFQAKALAIELYKWIRDAIRPQLANIKPVQVVLLLFYL